MRLYISLLITIHIQQTVSEAIALLGFATRAKHNEENSSAQIAMVVTAVEDIAEDSSKKYR